MAKLFARTTQDEREDPAAACWTKDAELLAAREAQGVADRRIVELETDVVVREADVKAAADALRVARALRAVKQGDEASVKKAEADLSRAQLALEVTEGELIALRRSIDDLRQRAHVALSGAWTRSAGQYRALSLARSRELAKVLMDGRRLELELEAIYGAASRSFSWGSPEARAFGTAANLDGIHGGPAHLMLRVLLPDRPGIAGSGTIEEWASTVTHCLGADPLVDRDVSK